MSAREKKGMDELIRMITDTLYADRRETTFFIPYSEGRIVSDLCNRTEVLSQAFIENGVRLVVKCSESDRNRYVAYRIKEG